MYPKLSEIVAEDLENEKNKIGANLIERYPNLDLSHAGQITLLLLANCAALKALPGAVINYNARSMPKMIVDPYKSTPKIIVDLSKDFNLKVYDAYISLFGVRDLSPDKFIRQFSVIGKSKFIDAIFANENNLTIKSSHCEKFFDSLRRESNIDKQLQHVKSYLYYDTNSAFPIAYYGNNNVGLPLYNFIIKLLQSPMLSFDNRAQAKMRMNLHTTLFAPSKVRNDVDFVFESSVKNK